MRTKAASAPLSDADQEEIRTLYQGGSSVPEVARMLHRPTSEVFALVADLQAARRGPATCAWCGCLGTTMPGDTPDESGKCSTCRRRPRRAALNVPPDRGTGKPRKLTDSAVADIRAAKGHVHAQELAKQYAVSLATISMIWTGRGRFAAVAESGGGVGAARGGAVDGAAGPFINVHDPIHRDVENALTD